MSPRAAPRILWAEGVQPNCALHTASHVILTTLKQGFWSQVTGRTASCYTLLPETNVAKVTLQSGYGSGRYETGKEPCKISLVFDVHASADTHKHTLPYGGLSLPLTHREAVKEAWMTKEEGEEEHGRMKMADVEHI